MLGKWQLDVWHMKRAMANWFVQAPSMDQNGIAPNSWEGAAMPPGVQYEDTPPGWPDPSAGGCDECRKSAQARAMQSLGLMNIRHSVADFMDITNIHMILPPKRHPGVLAALLMGALFAASAAALAVGSGVLS